MTRHDETQLWSYAGRELEPGSAKLLEHHLEECPECSEKLEAVILAREALLLARQAKPLVAWAGIDAAVDAVIDRRLRRQASRSRSWALALAVPVAGLALAWFVASPGSSVTEPTPAAFTPALVSEAPQSRVELAKNLKLSGTGASSGAPVREGDVIQTGAGDANALVQLADKSRVRVASTTTVGVERVAVDEVSLVLEQGRVAIHASHAARKKFVVHSGNVDVHVVGTVFAVSRTGAVTDVSVLDGRVRVETTAGDSVNVEAGQRVRFSGRNVVRGGLTPSMTRELAAVKDETGSAMASASGAVLPAQGGALPRLDPREARSRQVALAPSSTGPPTSLPPLPEVLVEAPPTPPAPAADWAPLPASATPKPIARDLESLFLQRADAAVTKGNCESFMLGLEEIASDAQLNERTELARILRARCFEIGLRPKQAMNEYRKYLETYPSGRFVAEARDATGQ